MGTLGVRVQHEAKTHGEISVRLLLNGVLFGNMGIRLECYAIDTRRFEQLVERPLWEVFAEFKRMPPAACTGFNVFCPQINARYVGTFDRRVLKYSLADPQQEHFYLSDEALEADPELQQRTRDYLATATSEDIAFLVRDLPTFDGVAYVETITSGYRFGWLGSLLGAAHKLGWHSPLFSTLQTYIARICQGYRCGYPMKLDRPRPIAEFPVQPQENVDLRMSVLSHEECLDFVELVATLLQTNPVFEVPPMYQSVTSFQKVDWNELVSEMAQKFLSIRCCVLEKPSLLSFVG
jgi:hypothetical protein